MAQTRELRDLYQKIHKCRKCDRVLPSLCSRKVIHKTYNAQLALMAQAPSEGGVRRSGVHWIGKDGKLRRPGGNFLDKFLQTFGYSINPANRHYARPYTTNVLHCWTGRTGKRDRSPSKSELRACKHYWIKELQIVRTRVLILLGKPASEAFVSVCNMDIQFAELLRRQGETMKFGGLKLKRFVLPHPTAPYHGKSELYDQVFGQIRLLLRT